MPRENRRPSRFIAVLRQRCPNCRRGQVFKGIFEMNDTCPVCGITFQREPGYFLGAMYFSYALGVPIIAGLTGILKFTLLSSWELQWVVLPAWGIYLLLVPAVFRYSRVLWMHFDRYFNPDQPPNDEKSNEKA
jgi:uncharacterized protein (DUF983 family)